MFIHLMLFIYCLSKLRFIREVRIFLNMNLFFSENFGNIFLDFNVATFDILYACCRSRRSSSLPQGMYRR